MSRRCDRHDDQHCHGAEYIHENYGDTVVTVPCTMPGFDIAHVCTDAWREQANERTIGMLLLNHGIFSFGDSEPELYERMITLVARAGDSHPTAPNKIQRPAVYTGQARERTGPFFAHGVV